MVDRPQARAGGDDERQRELAGEIPHGVAERQRHEQAADALADEIIGALTGPPCGTQKALGLDPLPRELRPEMR